MTADPYTHHPNLRGKIKDPQLSYFRAHQPRDLDDQMAALGYGDDWRFSDETREAMRSAFLANWPGGDIWIFAYGSVMWDPAFEFTEVRQGQVMEFARKFCLKDTFGVRGSPQVPGLMAALDGGSGCTGLVFRIDAAKFEIETEVIWRREMIAPAYRPAFVTVQTHLGPVEALTFLADHASDDIFPDLSHEEQVHYLATGSGFLGTSQEYIENIAAQIEALGLVDEDLMILLRDVRAYATKDQTDGAQAKGIQD